MTRRCHRLGSFEPTPKDLAIVRCIPPLESVQQGVLYRPTAEAPAYAHSVTLNYLDLLPLFYIFPTCTLLVSGHPSLLARPPRVPGLPL